MSEDTRGETITFTMDIPTGKIEKVKQLLEGLEVKFNPNDQIIAFNEDMMSQSVAIGQDLWLLVERINWILEEDGLTPTIPEGHEGWNIQRRQAFLQFAIDNYDWDNDKMNKERWADEGIDWEELTTRCPRVFGEQKA